MPVYKLAKGGKIGVLVDVGSTVTHTHIGTTVFNNFNKDYANLNWNLDKFITRNFRKKLPQAGFEYVELGTLGYTYAQLEGLVNYKSRQWKLNAKKQDVFNRLKNTQGITGVIVIKEKEIVARLECSGGPCSERRTNNSGLYTRSMFFSTKYLPVASIETNVFLLGPLADLARGTNMKKLEPQRAMILKDYEDPKDFKNISAEEWMPIETKVKSYFDKLTTAIVDELAL